MALLTDILAWSQASLPAWQQDALRRLFQRDSVLEEKDYEELYLLLKASHGVPIDQMLAPIPLSETHLPSSPKPGVAVILRTMRDLQDVNRLAPQQSLAFSPKGITVIYGPNASGKSGYARVLKRACRARDNSEVVLPDAGMPSAKTSTPSAVFEIESGGSSSDVLWLEGATPPPELSEIAVFDSRCARLYLADEQDVAYLPYGLDIVEGLANEVIPELDRRLHAEIGAIAVDPKPFQHLLGDTSVGRLVAGLCASSALEDIDALAELSEDESRRLQVLRVALAEPDPKAKSKELRLAAQRVKELAERVDKAWRRVGDDTLLSLQKQHGTTVAALEAESIAAEALRAGESLLPGTGESAWKALFEAARRFSIDAAYPDCPFPHTEAGAVCPLCQQTISEPGGAERLVRFETYIREDVAQRASAERERLAESQQLLEKLQLDAGLGKSLEAELEAMDASLPAAIRAFIRASRSGELDS